MGAEAGAVAAAIAKATKASGVIVKLSPDDFQAVLNRAGKVLIVCAIGGLFSTNYQYLTSYKGLAFFTKAKIPLVLPPGAETVLAEKIWIPQ